MNLLEACRLDPEQARQLVEQGANVNIQSINDWTPLHHACLYDRTSIVRILVEAGAYVNAKTDRGDIPLHFTWYSNPELMEYLIAHGADVNLPTKSGKTMIQVGCEIMTGSATMRLLYIHSTEFPVGHTHSGLRSLVALYAGMCWKRSDVGGLPSYVMVNYLL
jgi:hypothetical protein